jgi:hypothetical protein
VACLRLVSDDKVTTEVRTFQTTTADLLHLSGWLAENVRRLSRARVTATESTLFCKLNNPRWSALKLSSAVRI